MIDPEIMLEAYLGQRHLAADFLKNKHLDAAFVARIIETADEDELWWIATKNCLDENQILFLSLHSNPDIRQRIAYNKRTKEAVLSRLALDDSALVSEAARSQLESRKPLRSRS